ncbi:hypothetical protein CEP53_010135 [Fusarium sp. AF-6]|nr:hypothetical protein CEP53_010135 [Fusarium sp. AF-6]
MDVNATGDYPQESVTEAHCNGYFPSGDCSRPLPSFRRRATELRPTQPARSPTRSQSYPPSPISFSLTPWNLNLGPCLLLCAHSHTDRPCLVPTAYLLPTNYLLLFGLFSVCPSGPNISGTTKPTCFQKLSSKGKHSDLGSCITHRGQ